MKRLAIVLAACGAPPAPAAPAPIHDVVAHRPPPPPAPRCTDACLPAIDMVDLGGRTYTAQALAGHVVVVSFWATWAHPMTKQVPVLSALYDREREHGVVMLGVLADASASDADLAGFTAANPMSYPSVRGTPEILKAFDYPDLIPTTFVYGKSGKLVEKLVGVADEARLDKLIERAQSL